MLELVQQPLAPPHGIVVGAVLLDLDVGQVAAQVVDVLRVVGLVGEPGEPAPVQPQGQVAVVGAQDVDPHVEFLIAEE